MLTEVEDDVGSELQSFPIRKSRWVCSKRHDMTTLNPPRQIFSIVPGNFAGNSQLYFVLTPLQWWSGVMSIVGNYFVCITQSG